VNCRQLFINPADTETIGRSQIQELGKEMGYSGEFAILSAASTATNQNAWIKFMKAELKLPKYKNMKLVKIYYGNDDPKDSLQATEAMLQAYPNLKGIFGANEGSIAGVINAVRETHRKIVAIGYDSGKQQKDAIRDGTEAGAITQNPVGIGYKTVEAAVKSLKGEKLPKVIDTGFYWYDKTNIDDPKIAAVLYD
jgi:ribose transport system substrate-binding protein